MPSSSHIQAKSQGSLAAQFSMDLSYAASCGRPSAVCANGLGIAPPSMGTDASNTDR